MINQQLVDFIKKELAKGVDREAISRELASGDWNPQDIQEGFEKASASAPNLSTAPIPPAFKHTDFPVQQSIKENLKITDIIISFILLFLEILIFFEMTSYSINHHDGWDGLALVYYFLPLALVVSFIGIVQSRRFLAKRKFNFFPVILLIISILTFPPLNFFLSKMISQPIIEKQYKPIRDAYQAQKIASENDANVVYKKLAENYKNPQKVIFVDFYKDLYPVIGLEDGDLIEVTGLTFPRQKIYKDFFIWAEKNLVGQKVQVILSSEIQQLGSCAYNNGNQTIKQIRQKHNIDPEAGGVCQFINADIVFNGASIYDKLK